MNFSFDALHGILLILLLVLLVDRLSLKRRLAAVERMSENYKQRARRAQERQKPRQAARRKGWW